MKIFFLILLITLSGCSNHLSGYAYWKDRNEAAYAMSLKYKNHLLVKNGRIVKHKRLEKERDRYSLSISMYPPVGELGDAMPFMLDEFLEEANYICGGKANLNRDDIGVLTISAVGMYDHALPNTHAYFTCDND